jgi:hypothetical protein
MSFVLLMDQAEANGRCNHLERHILTFTYYR